MANNLDRFKADLARLITQGERLKWSLIREIDRKGFEKQVKEQLKGEKAAEFLKSLPDFKTDYESWYS